MSSYQPVSLPQNPYASIPYSQSFPDEPASESSQLQAPLHNQPQNLYPSLDNYGYAQQQPPVYMGQPGQFYGGGAPQGYPQGPQFMMIPVDPERRGLAMKISDLEKELDSGWYFVYKIYLYINIVAAIFGLLQLCFCLFLLPIFPSLEGLSLSIAILAILIFAGLYAWGLHFSLVLKNAMNDKSLTGARRGLKSYTAYSVYGFVIMIGMIWAAECFRKTQPEFSEQSWTHYYVRLFISGVGTLVLHNFAIRKIIDLLMQRDALVQELNTRFGTNMA